MPEEGKGLGSFINCGGKNKSGNNNCEFCLRNGELFVRTTKDIDSYHELFTILSDCLFMLIMNLAGNPVSLLFSSQYV